MRRIARRLYRHIAQVEAAQASLANNRAQIKSQLVFGLEGVVNRMYRSARNEIYYGRFMPVAELVDRIDSVDEADLARCAAAYFDPANLVVATHGPTPAAS